MNSPIKNVQRGTTAAAGTITISAVNMSKAFVNCQSKGSAGTVAATGNITLNPSKSTTLAPSSSGTALTTPGNDTFGSLTGSISGGTTNLTSAVYSAKLTSSTSLSCDGPVEWEVIEYA